MDGPASGGWELPFRDSLTAMFQSEMMSGRTRVGGRSPCRLFGRAAGERRQRLR